MDLLWLGASFLNIEKLVATVKMHLLANALMGGAVRVLEGLCHVCGLQQGLGACPCLWPIRNGRSRETLSEHFFTIQALAFAAKENAEWGYYLRVSLAIQFTLVTKQPQHLIAGYAGNSCLYMRGYKVCVTFLNSPMSDCNTYILVEIWNFSRLPFRKCMQTANLSVVNWWNRRGKEQLSSAKFWSDWF